MFKRLMVTAIATSAAGLACNSLAEPATTTHWLLAKYDQDGDRAISIEEISQKRERVFNYMDADQDGGVTLAEYSKMDANRRAQILEARFAVLDSNRDGEVSVAEYSDYSGSFDRFDQDRNGVITETEIAKPKTPALEDHTKCVLWFCIKTELD